MNVAITNKINLGYGLALLTLFLIGWVSYQSTQRLVESAHSVSHTHQVLNHIGGILGTLNQAESEQRGYLFTRDDAYVAERRLAVAAVHEELAQVRTLTADNPAQQQALDRLE